MSFFRPTAVSGQQANSICWLIWHSARIQDAQLAQIADVEQVWFGGGWVDRFALDLPRDAHGYGHTPRRSARCEPWPISGGYYHAVHKMTLEYVAGITAAELARIVDDNWDPPVTASVRLVSIIDDCAQHLGQAAFVRGDPPKTYQALSGGIDRALVGWPFVGMPLMVLLGLGVRHGATPVDVDAAGPRRAAGLTACSSPTTAPPRPAGGNGDGGTVPETLVLVPLALATPAVGCSPPKRSSRCSAGSKEMRSPIRAATPP